MGSAVEVVVAVAMGERGGTRGAPSVRSTIVVLLNVPSSSVVVPCIWSAKSIRLLSEGSGTRTLFDACLNPFFAVPTTTAIPTAEIA